MAKFCKNCGASLEEGARFCENCGAVVEAPPPAQPAQQQYQQPQYGAQQQYQQPQYGAPPPQQRENPLKKFPKKLLIIIIIVAVVIGVVVAVTQMNESKSKGKDPSSVNSGEVKDDGPGKDDGLGKDDDDSDKDSDKDDDDDSDKNGDNDSNKDDDDSDDNGNQGKDGSTAPTATKEVFIPASYVRYVTDEGLYVGADQYGYKLQKNNDGSYTLNMTAEQQKAVLADYAAQIERTFKNLPGDFPGLTKVEANNDYSKVNIIGTDELFGEQRMDLIVLSIVGYLVPVYQLYQGKGEDSKSVIVMYNTDTGMNTTEIVAPDDLLNMYSG